MNTTIGTFIVLVLMLLAVITKVVQYKKYKKKDTPEVDYSKKFMQVDFLVYVGFFVPASIIVNIVNFQLFGMIALSLLLISAIGISIVEYRKKRGLITEKKYAKLIVLFTITTIIGLLFMGVMGFTM